MKSNDNKKKQFTFSLYFNSITRSIDLNVYKVLSV